MSNENKKFIIYRSSAGSGKTFTLVKEYLKLALSDTQIPPQHYRSILAITFTNKASAEMKERILKALKELSSGQYSGGTKTLQELLIAEMNVAPEQLKKRSQNLLQEILHNYADFAICTIDSFVHRIIRTFAYDLQLSVNFNIETDEDNVLNQCIDELISEIGNDPRLTKIMLEFSKSRIEENKNWQIDRDIKNFAANIIDENNRLQLDKLKDISVEQFNQLREKLQAFIRVFENKLITLADAAFELLTKKNLAPENFYRGNSGIYSYFKKIKNKDFESESLLKSYVLQTINENKWLATKNSSSENEAIESISDAIKKIYSEIEEYRNANLEKYYLYSSIFKNIYALTVINEIEKLILKFKEEQNILFISEFNNRISEVILKEPVPFIYERIGEKYKHFLIDEFQDTSVVQWHNLLPLIDNSLSEGQFSMVVGDGKQSIYRWRGGEVDQFAELPNIRNHFNNEFTPLREQNLIHQHEIKQLNSNFRSRSSIVQFNNEVFRFFSDTLLQEHGKRIYIDLEQQSNPKNDKGFVSFDFIPSAEENEMTEELMLSKMKEYILFNLEKGFHHKDIAVLVRFNKTGNKVADYLMREGIPVVSSDSLLLVKSPEISFLINALHYINNNYNSTAASAIITYLCSNKYIDVVHEHDLLVRLNNSEHSTSLDDLLHEHHFKFNRNYFLSLPLYDCCVELINLFELQVSNALYMQFFLDEVITFTQNNSSNINVFMEWWENRKTKASVILPAGTDAIRIMTIHASKGLEFPVVILPYCDWTVKATDYVWIDLAEEDTLDLPVTLVKTSKDIRQTSYRNVATLEEEKQVLDNLNLLYVALTRPEQHLHIISRIPKHYQDNIYKWLYAYLMQKGLIVKDVYHYTFGESIQNEHELVKPIQEEDVLKGLDVRNWKEIIRIKQANEAIWNLEAMEEKRDKGILMHYILSKIKYIKDIERAIHESVYEGVLAENDKAETEQAIRSLLNKPTISCFFTEDLKVKNEVGILTSTGQTLRPDRLVFNNTQVHVIDYKTGSASDVYHQQLEKYADALRNLGYTSIKKHLIYIHEESVEELID